MLEDSKAVELIVRTRDGALVFQETFWQILHCVSLLRAQSHKHALSSRKLCYSRKQMFTQLHKNLIPKHIIIFFIVPHLSAILECINRIREDCVEHMTWRQSSTVLGTLLMCHKGGASQHSPMGGTVLLSSLLAKLGCTELSFRYLCTSKFRVYSGQVT